MLKYSNRTVIFDVRIIECSDNRSLDNREPTVPTISIVHTYILIHVSSSNVFSFSKRTTYYIQIITLCTILNHLLTYSIHNYFCMLKKIKLLLCKYPLTFHRQESLDWITSRTVKLFVR